MQRAGDIGLFKIVSESGVASGVRRIEALTGEGALEYVEENDSLLKELAGLVRGSREDLKDKTEGAHGKRKHHNHVFNWQFGDKDGTDAAFRKAEIEKWRPIIKSANIKAE